MLEKKFGEEKKEKDRFSLQISTVLEQEADEDKSNRGNSKHNSPGKGLVNALCVFPTYISPKGLCKLPKVPMLHLVNTVKTLQVVLY